MASTSAPSSSSSLPPGLARKVRKCLDMRLEEPSLTSALASSAWLVGNDDDDSSKSTSAGGGTNTPAVFKGVNTSAEAARRALRLGIERRGLEINEDYLRASEAAIQALDALDTEIAEIARACSAVTSSVRETRAQTASLAEAAANLQTELAVNARKTDLVADFLQKYQLTAEEVAALSFDTPGDAFFAALARVRVVHANCRQLLRTHHQRAGLELMDGMAAHQESAYERLCRWLQAGCRALGEVEAPEVSPSLRRAAASLRARPALFQYCVEEVSNVRHSAVFRRFVAALTRGGPDGVPRPIEAHAAEPLRYVGDMLGWLHQAMATERELLDALLVGTNEAGDGEAAAAAEADAEDAEADGAPSPKVALAMALAKVAEGVCRPFQVRVEQSLAPQSGRALTPDSALRMVNLLSFYRSLIGGVLLHEEGSGSSTNPLVASLEKCEATAHSRAMDDLRARGVRLKRSTLAVPRDLSAPPALTEGARIANALVEAQLAAPSTEDKGALDVAIERFDELMLEALRPLMEAVTSASSSVTASSADGAIPARRHTFIANCYDAILRPLELSSLPFTPKAIEELRASRDNSVLETAATAASEALAQSGLDERAKRLAAYGPDDNLASDPALSPATLGEALRGAFRAIGGETPSALETLARGELRDRAGAAFAQAVIEAYAPVYDALSSRLGEAGVAEAAKCATERDVRTVLGV
ncbi:conserved oligomeric Golgi complex subunit 6 [Pycnococcus provasolii]